MISISPSALVSITNQALSNATIMPRNHLNLERSVNGQFLHFRGELEFTPHQVAISTPSQKVLRSYLSDVTEVPVSSVLAERFPIDNDGFRTPLDEILNDLVSHTNRFRSVTNQINRFPIIESQARQEVNTLFLATSHAQFKAQSEVHTAFSELPIEGPITSIAAFLGASSSTEG